MKKQLQTTSSEIATIPQTLGLADMSESQLAETFTKLDATREHYDNLSGICATLQGLVLIEVKEKVGHGKYGHWLESNFPKSHKTANRFQRIAEEFLARAGAKNTPEAKQLKLDTGVQFDNVNTSTQLLLTDLAASLSAVRGASLDMSHPMIQAISTYAGGRSYKQMWLDLPPALLGGDHRRRDEDGEPVPRIRRTDEEIERDTFESTGRVICGDARRALTNLLTMKGPVGRPGKQPIPRAWDLLDDKALQELKEMAIDLRDGILESEKRRAQARPSK